MHLSPRQLRCMLRRHAPVDGDSLCQYSMGMLSSKQHTGVLRCALACTLPAR